VQELAVDAAKVDPPDPIAIDGDEAIVTPQASGVSHKPPTAIIFPIVT